MKKLWQRRIKRQIINRAFGDLIDKGLAVPQPDGSLFIPDDAAFDAALQQFGEDATEGRGKT